MFTPYPILFYPILYLTGKNKSNVYFLAINFDKIFGVLGCWGVGFGRFG
jgi:hypothetical protein